MAASGILAGRVAIVTGGGSGIGRAVCGVLARDGARVAVVDVNADSAIETAAGLSPGQHEAFAGDVSSSSKIREILGSVRNKFAAVPTIAVNAAGITRDKFLHKMTEEQFDEVIKVNLKGTFLVCQAVATMMREAEVESGSIVNIASIVGKSGNLGQTNYAASKAGVVGMTKAAAWELGRHNIRVNSVLPGFIKTPMTDKVPEAALQGLMMLVPLGRMGQPEEVAEVCSFLASDRSSYMTGASIDVTGGLFM